MTGRLHVHKVHGSLLAAARLLASSSAPTAWRFVIVGDGSKRKEVEAEAADLVARGVVEFARPGLEVLPLVSMADVGVLMTNDAALAEGCSNSIMEYMASGLPVVCCESGGNKELVTDCVSGYVVPPGDAAALAHGSSFFAPTGASESGWVLRARLGSSATSHSGGWSTPTSAFTTTVCGPCTIALRRRCETVPGRSLRRGARRQLPGRRRDSTRTARDAPCPQGEPRDAGGYRLWRRGGPVPWRRVALGVGRRARHTFRESGDLPVSASATRTRRRSSRGLFVRGVSLAGPTVVSAARRVDAVSLLALCSDRDGFADSARYQFGLGGPLIAGITGRLGYEYFRRRALERVDCVVVQNRTQARACTEGRGGPTISCRASSRLCPTASTR